MIGSAQKEDPVHDPEQNFILQQGLEDTGPQDKHARFEALLFQPRLIGLAVLVGIALQSPAVFLSLWVLLWWNALRPRLNPFDALYNLTLGARPGAIRLRPAPAPRRFAQGMAGTFALAIGAMLRLEWFTAAYVLEGFLGAAIVALVFGRFCLGSYIYHLLLGKLNLPAKPCQGPIDRTSSR